MKLAKEASRAGGLYPTVLNGANEQAVSLFLEGKISFLQIGELTERALSLPLEGNAQELQEILAADRRAREAVIMFYEKSRV